MRFSPALCTWYEPARLHLPCFAQPKLNGLRAIYINGHFYSRSGNRWVDTLLQHILEPLRTHFGRHLILDGEFYRHGWTLDRIAEAVSLFRKAPCKDTFEIGFYVFDLVAEAPFPDRSRQLNSQLSTLSSQLTATLPVPTIRVDSLAAADALHHLNIQAGFEGTIYRTGQGGYQPGRNRCLMKRKETRGSGFTQDRDFKPRVDRWSHSAATLHRSPEPKQGLTFRGPSRSWTITLPKNISGQP